MSESRFSRQDWWFLAAMLLLALVLRLDFLVANNFVIDSDEAIVGLMAKHIVEGADLPVFYYGQHYMGSFEPLLAALSFKVFGISNAALKAVPLIFSLLLLILLYALGLQLGGRCVSRVAVLLAAVPPSTLLIWSAKARGGFIELVCLGTYALLPYLPLAKTRTALICRHRIDWICAWFWLVG